MKRVFEYLITADTNQLTIRDYLHSLGYSRHIILALKNTFRGILLNGETPYLNTRLQPGDSLRITLDERESSEKITPVHLPLSILYEDSDIMVLNKAANMPIHPSPGNYDNTLANSLAWYFKEKGEAFVFRCITRLDRDTTGALIVAKHSLSASLLSFMMQNKQIHRTYHAIVTGDAPLEGRIEVPIARAAGSLLERCTSSFGGQAAITHYHRLASDGTYSLVELTLDTGRTHQIRVHMKHIGHPLPGDFLYNPDYALFKRQPLHSHTLKLLHPITSEPLCFTAPYPQDFREFVRRQGFTVME